MDAAERVERSLERAVRRAGGQGAPPKLAAAIRHAVFPGGARVRPRLTLAVAAACGAQGGALAEAAGAAIELLHCASLAHDDLPCFDGAAERRGLPSVHAAFGEPLAVLAGDALIVMAFETLALAGARTEGAPRLAAVIGAVAAAAGAPHGIAAGQAWESESVLDSARYRAAKTGALFVAATACGALAAGCDATPWRGLGALLGDAYQVADDLLDAAGGGYGGKPGGQDARLGRPNAVAELGLQGAVAHLRDVVRRAMAAVPDVPGALALRELVRLQALRLAPERLLQSAA